MKQIRRFISLMGNENQKNRGRMEGRPGKERALSTMRQDLPRALAKRPGRMGLLLRTLGMVGMAVALTTPTVATAANTPQRPNFVIILGDDLGFADMGSFGSEIKTPNLDSLATDGVRFTNFYTHASCSPTRSMLLSGVDTHLNGLGNMDEWTAPNQRGVDGYEGVLSDRVATLPQLLKDAGYHTYMVGKSGIWASRPI